MATASEFFGYLFCIVLMISRRSTDFPVPLKPKPRVSGCPRDSHCPRNTTHQHSQYRKHYFPLRQASIYASVLDSKTVWAFCFVSTILHLSSVPAQCSSLSLQRSRLLMQLRVYCYLCFSPYLTNSSWKYLM